MIRISSEGKESAKGDSHCWLKDANKVINAITPIVKTPRNY